MAHDPIPLNEVLHFNAISHHPSSGHVSNLDSVPGWGVYEESTDTEIATGSMTARASRTGEYRGTVSVDAANGFEIGKFYNITALGTIGTFNSKAIVSQFRVVASEDDVGFAPLSATDKNTLGTAHIVDIALSQMAILGTSQVVDLNTASRAILGTAHLVDIAASEMAILATSNAVQVTLSAAQLATLSTTNVVDIAVSQMAILGTAHVVDLNAASKAVLGTSHVVDLNAASKATLGTSHVVDLSVAARAVLGTSTSSISAADKATLGTSQAVDLALGARADVSAVVGTNLSDINLDHLLGTSAVGADVFDDSVIAQMVSASPTADWDTYSNETASLEILDTQLDSIVSDTNQIIQGTSHVVDINAATKAVLGTSQAVDLSTGARSDVNAEVVDALNTDTYAEPGVGAPAATTSLVAKIGYLYKAWRNKHVQGTAAYTLYNDDTSTAAQSATLTDDGTEFTRNEMGSG